MNDSQQRTDKQGPPWFPLYASDWLGDPELSACSLTAQGLLMRLMCVAWPAGGTVRLTRKGMHGLCAATTPAEVDRAFEELKDADRVSVVEDGKHLQVSITRLEVEAERANVMYSKRVDRATRAAEARWGACSKHARSMQRACSSNAPDATVQYSTVQDNTDCVKSTIGATDEQRPLTPAPQVSEGNLLLLDTLLKQHQTKWIEAIQRAGRPQSIIMAPTSQRRWLGTLRDVASQMVEVWPATPDEALSGLQRMVASITLSPAHLTRYMNDPHFLKTDWPKLVAPGVSVKQWTANDERKTQDAITSMLNRRSRVCQAVNDSQQ